MQTFDKTSLLLWLSWLWRTRGQGHQGPFGEPCKISNSRPNADNCWRGGRGGNPNADHCPLLMAIQQQFTAQCTCSKNVSNLSLINLRWRCLVAPNNAQATILGMCPIQQNEPVTRWDFFQVTQQDVQENSVVKPWNCAPLLRGQAFNGTERRNTEKEWLID